MASTCRHHLTVDPVQAGVERLWANKSLTINGITVAPSCWFDGTGLNAVAKTWTCRQTGTVMSEAGAGASPTFDADGPVLLEKVCKCNNGKYLASVNAAFCDITTEDAVMLAIVGNSSVGNSTASSKYQAGVRGWYFFDNGAFMTMTVRDGGATVNINGPSLGNQWEMHMVVLDRSGSGVIYSDATAGAAANIAGVASLTSATPLYAMFVSGGLVWNGPIALFAIYKQAAWLDTHLQPALARQLHALFVGEEATFQASGIRTPNPL